MSRIRCDECGRFVSYDDLESKKAVCYMETPDSDFTAEVYVTLCRRCNVPANSMGGYLGYSGD